MASLRSLLIRVLAAVLLLQSGVAVAHCLRGMGAGEGMLVEICSAEGIRTLRLDARGEPAADHAPATEAGFCPACHGLPAVDLPLPPLLSTPAWLSEAVAWAMAPGDCWQPPARAPPYTTRAPPVTA